MSRVTAFRSLTVAVTVATSALMLVGCGSQPPATSIFTAEGLRLAYVGAGGECASPVQHTEFQLPAQGAECADGTLLLTFTGESDRDRVELRLKQSDRLPLLVGDNWIIAGDSVDSELANSLGGVLVGPYAESTTPAPTTPTPTTPAS